MREIRINKLVELDEALEQIIRERAEAAMSMPDAPPGATTGMMTITKKVGPKGVVEEWIVDRPLLQERRALMEQVAKELGEHNDKLQLSGSVDINTANSAREKLMEGLDAITEGEASDTSS